MSDFVGESGRIASSFATDAKDALTSVMSNGLGIRSRFNSFIDADEISRSLMRSSAGGGAASSSTGTMVAAFLRMMGLDEAKLGVMALNVLVYLAEMVARVLIGDEDATINEIPQYRSIVEEVRERTIFLDFTGMLLLYFLNFG